MPRFAIAPVAQGDIDLILTWSEVQFGNRARRRYEALLTQAILDVAENPELPGSCRRDEVGSDFRTYHLTHSKRRIPRSIGRVKQPRHFLLYRVRNDEVQIVRVLHDGMDLASHLPPDYRSDVNGDDN